MKKEEKKIVSEPAVVYGKRSMQIFSSVEEMNEADAKAMAGITGLQHLENATLLTKRIFAEELKTPMNKKIQFK